MSKSKTAKKKAQNRFSGLEKWQQLMAAAIGAAVSLAAILVPILVTTSQKSSAKPPEHSDSTAAPTPDFKVAITSFSQAPYPADQAPYYTGEEYSFTGIVTDWKLAKAEGAQIFVITRNAKVALSSSQAWLTSPPASVTGNKTWHVSWGIDKPPEDAHWSAIMTLSAQPVSLVTKCFKIRDDISGILPPGGGAGGGGSSNYATEYPQCAHIPVLSKESEENVSVGRIATSTPYTAP